MAKVAGICAKTSAPAVLDGPLNELEKQTEYAVLAAIDGFQSLFRKSADEECYQIAPYVYHRPRLVLEFVSANRLKAHSLGPNHLRHVVHHPPSKSGRPVSRIRSPPKFLREALEGTVGAPPRPENDRSP
ncbi:hypothetical protein CC2G_011313 [Coprinopsis cinerea AmutBmut pab1-1]|nr:hypothetical protein CC2G_011313 [Coprinopsis cinerea AmutBmut pab1-1]